MSTPAEAEVERLSRLLRCGSEDIAFLRRFDVAELRALRLAVFERMYADHHSTYARIGSASRLLPIKVTAPLAERMLPARVSAGVVASLPAEHAATMAARMSDEYVADVSMYLSPTLAGPVLSRLPVDVVVSVARVLDERGDHATMAEIVSALTDEQVSDVVEAIDDAATLVQVALRITDEDALQRLTGLIPEERMQEMVRWGSRRAQLWPELMGLLGRLPAAQRKRLMSGVRAS